MTVIPRTDDRTDEALMAAEDDASMAELFTRHHRPVFAFLRRSGGAQAPAEDLTQEVFLRVLRYRTSYDASRPFQPWLYRIARNVLADHFARHRPTSQSEIHDEPDDRPSPERFADARQRAARLEVALRRLSPEQRDALLLARFHSLSYRLIGETLGCSEAAVKARVFRALRSLSSFLDPAGESNA